MLRNRGLLQRWEPFPPKFRNNLPQERGCFFNDEIKMVNCNADVGCRYEFSNCLFEAYTDKVTTCYCHFPFHQIKKIITTTTQLRPTKTGSNICCTHLSYTFSESWVRKDSVGTCPEKFSRWKFSGTERFTKKFRFSLISLAASKKKYRARVPTVLMPQIFPIASLNRFGPMPDQKTM